MAWIEMQKPTDQPTGTVRLLHELRSALDSGQFRTLHIVVAFTRVGPLLRLKEAFVEWRERGNSIFLITGIDQKGTSKEALEFALEHFTETHVAHVAGKFSPTFHPKMYVFGGDNNALAYIGSNNLTVGGTELNFESYIRLALEFPEDNELMQDLVESWKSALSVSLSLDKGLLNQLVVSGAVLPERKLQKKASERRKKDEEEQADTLPDFPGIGVVPPSPIPKVVAKGGAHADKKTMGVGPEPELTMPTLHARALVIQVVPHANGEVHLSKTAINQDPAFFGWPFEGLTTPKFAHNDPYPQRIPDPVVDLKVIDGNGKLAAHHPEFSLNTVYYTPKAEIRVTVPQDVVKLTRTVVEDKKGNDLDYPVLLMSAAPGDGYGMDVYLPGTPEYEQLLAACNQTMPSGGGTKARRFGWL